MALDATLSINELRASLVGLAYCCPVDGCNPKDCPLFLLRKLPPSDRLLWLDSLQVPDLQYIAIYHQVCMKHKLERRRSPSTSPRPNPQS